MIKKVENADGSPARLSFFHTSVYADQPMGDQPTLVKDAWHTAYVEGHEAGDHTQTHNTTTTTSLSEWESEIDTCLSWLTKPFDAADLTQYATPVPEHGAGIKLEDIFGFRTPKLEYNDDTFKVVNARDNFWYDCSIDEGGQDDQDGTNYFWPYTLENGSPGHDAFHEEPLSSHEGLWEMPVYELIVPPDELAEHYGVEPGLRDKLGARGLSANGKVTGLRLQPLVRPADDQGRVPGHPQVHVRPAAPGQSRAVLARRAHHGILQRLEHGAAGGSE